MFGNLTSEIFYQISQWSNTWGNIVPIDTKVKKVDRDPIYNRLEKVAIGPSLL